MEEVINLLLSPLFWAIMAGVISALFFWIESRSLRQSIVVFGVNFTIELILCFLIKILPTKNASVLGSFFFMTTVAVITFSAIHAPKFIKTPMCVKR
jgi:hypothetical protein